MFCENCGQVLENNMTYCPKCGSIIPQNQNNNQINNYNNNVNNNMYSPYQNYNTINNDNKVVFCNSCGKVLDLKLENCISCGMYNPMFKGVRNTTPPNYTYSKGYNTSQIVFYIINGIGLLFILLICFLPSIFSGSLNTGLTSFIVFFILFFYVFCIQLLFMKADLHWWGLFVPLYNNYLYYKLCTGNGWNCIIEYVLYGITLLCNIMKISFVANITSLISIIIPFVLLFKLGKAFGRSGILTLLFAFIIIPTTALSKNYQYEL